MSERHDVTHHTAGFTPRRARLKQPHLHVKPSTMAPSTSDTKTSAAIGCCGSAPGVWHSRTRRKRVRVILGHVVAAPRATEADRAGLPGPGSARRPPRRDQGEPRDLQPDLAGGHRSESAHPHPAIRSMPLRLSCEKIHRRAPPTEVAEVHRERRDVKNVSNRGGRERLARVKKFTGAPRRPARAPEIGPPACSRNGLRCVGSDTMSHMTPVGRRVVTRL